MGVNRHLPLVLVPIVLWASGPGVAWGQSALEIMQRQREAGRVRDEEETQRLRLVSRSGAIKERKFVRYTLAGPGDLDKILIRFLAPRDVENTGLLTWEARDGNDDQWLYLPATRKAKRIAASGKKNRFMGTDFAFEDLRPEGLALHRYTLTGSERIDGHDCFVIEAVPASERQASDSGYSRRRLWIRKDIYATVKREYYDKAGRLEKVETQKNLVNVKGRVWRADEIEMRDVRNGTRTIVIVEDRVVDQGLTDSFFTESELVR